MIMLMIMLMILRMIMFAVMVVAMFTQRKQTVNPLLAFVVQTFMLANVSTVDHTIWPLQYLGVSENTAQW